MSVIECGWLSWSGKFTACNPYDHLAVAQELANGMALYSVADDYLLDHGYVKIYRESFCGHKWFIDWRGFCQRLRDHIYVRYLRMRRMIYTSIAESAGRMKIDRR